MKQAAASETIPAAASKTAVTGKKWYCLNLFQKFALIFLLAVALPVSLIAINVSYQNRDTILASSEHLIETVKSSMAKASQTQQAESEYALDMTNNEISTISEEAILQLKDRLMQENSQLYAENLNTLVSESQMILRHKLMRLNKEIARGTMMSLDGFVKESQLVLNDLAAQLKIDELQTGNTKQFWDILLSYERFVHLSFVESSGQRSAQVTKKMAAYWQEDPLFTDQEPYLSLALAGEAYISGAMSKSGVASLRLFVPVKRNAEIRGVLVGVVTFLPLWEQVQARFFQHAELIYILDYQGSRLYPRLDVPVPPTTQEYLKKVGAFDETQGTFDQGEAMLAFVSLPSLKWKVVVVQLASSVATRTVSIQTMVSNYLKQLETDFQTATEEKVMLIVNEMTKTVEERKQATRQKIRTQHDASLASIVGDLARSVRQVAENVHHETLRNVIPIILGLGTIAVIIGIFVAGQIIKPIKSVTTIAQNISKGDVTQTMPQIVSHDELGVLLQSFHATIEYLSTIVRGAQKISEGEFSNEVTPVSERDALGIAFRKMTNYLRDIAALASNIARGDLSQVVTPKSESDVLGNAVYGMTLYLQRIARVARKVAGGDLSESSQPQSDKDFLGNAFTEMISRLRHLVTKIRAGANQLVTLSLETHSRAQEESESVEKILFSVGETSSSMTQMASSIGEVGESMKHLSSFVGETSSSIEELNSSIRQIVSHNEQLAVDAEETSGSIQEISASLQQIAETAQHSKMLSDGVTLDAVHGRDAVEKMIRSMNSIDQMTTVTVETIQHLNTRTESIETILGVIKDISDQTSLLAINASIIAKKAGARGRGFNVIADKVRKLADQSNLSAKEIARIIQNVDKESAHAAEVVSMGREKVHEGVELAELAGKALDKIITGANESSTVVARIAETTDEQTKISHYIMQSMERIVEMINQIKVATKEQEQSSSYIINQAEQVLLLSQQVKNSTLEQGEVVKHVTLAMDNISSQIQKTSERAKESTQAASTLLDHADALKQLVSQFIT